MSALQNLINNLDINLIQMPSDAVKSIQIQSDALPIINQTQNDTNQSQIMSIDTKSSQMTANDGKMYNASFRYGNDLKQRLENYKKTIGEETNFSLNKYLTKLIKDDLTKKGY